MVSRPSNPGKPGSDLGHRRLFVDHATISGDAERPGREQDAPRQDQRMKPSNSAWVQATTWSIDWPVRSLASIPASMPLL